MNSSELNSMLLQIEMSLSNGHPVKDYENLTSSEKEIFEEVALEAYSMRIKKIAVEIPAEWPDIIDTGLRTNN